MAESLEPARCCSGHYFNCTSFDSDSLQTRRASVSSSIEVPMLLVVQKVCSYTDRTPDYTNLLLRLCGRGLIMRWEAGDPELRSVAYLWVDLVGHKPYQCQSTQFCHFEPFKLSTEFYSLDFKLLTLY